MINVSHPFIGELSFSFSNDMVTPRCPDGNLELTAYLGNPFLNTWTLSVYGYESLPFFTSISQFLISLTLFIPYFPYTQQCKFPTLFVSILILAAQLLKTKYDHLFYRRAFPKSILTRLHQVYGKMLN